jgi:hypothetical protein
MDYVERRSSPKQRLRLQIQNYVTEYKERTPCIDCKMKYPAHVMDLDHVRGEKLYALALIHNQPDITWAKLHTELAKCDVVCANCHRERTHVRRCQIESSFRRLKGQRNRNRLG